MDRSKGGGWPRIGDGEFLPAIVMSSMYLKFTTLQIQTNLSNRLKAFPELQPLELHRQALKIVHATYRVEDAPWRTLARYLPRDRATKYVWPDWGVAVGSGVDVGEALDSGVTTSYVLQATRARRKRKRSPSPNPFEFSDVADEYEYPMPRHSFRPKGNASRWIGSSMKLSLRAKRRRRRRGVGVKLPKTEVGVGVQVEMDMEEEDNQIPPEDEQILPGTEKDKLLSHSGTSDLEDEDDVLALLYQEPESTREDDHNSSTRESSIAHPVASEDDTIDEPAEPAVTTKGKGKRKTGTASARGSTARHISSKIGKTTSILYVLKYLM